MGRRSRKERAAARKEKRANRKRERAKKKAEKGNTKAANRLNKRADKLDERATELKDAINNQLITGLSAKIININSLGNGQILAEWNYQASDLARYDALKIRFNSFLNSMRFFNPANNINGEINARISDTTALSPLTKNLDYTVRLVGVTSQGVEVLVDRTFVSKVK